MSELKKKVVLKSLKEKKERLKKSTYSVCFEKQVKDELEKISTETGLSLSFIVNELIKRDVMP